MKSNLLLEALESHESYQFAESLSSVFIYAQKEPRPFAQPVLANGGKRTLCWILQPGESTIVHQVPRPFYMLVLKGYGMLAFGDEPEQEFGPNTLLISASNEALSMRAVDEEMIVVSFLQTVLIAEPG